MQNNDSEEKYNLDEAKCINDSDVNFSEYTDREINGIIYRVWSAFENEKDAAECLENLMLRKLETELYKLA